MPTWRCSTGWSGVSKVKMCQGLRATCSHQALRRGKEKISRALGGSVALLTPWFQISGLYTVREWISAVFRLPSMWEFAMAALGPLSQDMGLWARQLWWLTQEIWTDVWVEQRQNCTWLQNGSSMWSSLTVWLTPGTYGDSGVLRPSKTHYIDIVGLELLTNCVKEHITCTYNSNPL